MKLKSIMPIVCDVVANNTLESVNRKKPCSKHPDEIALKLGDRSVCRGCAHDLVVAKYQKHIGPLEEYRLGWHQVQAILQIVIVQLPSN